tara:strand:+ start:44 stop:376 length:333 start_codon:yes stop_codon:yes gene_type:complete
MKLKLDNTFHYAINKHHMNLYGYLGAIILNKLIFYHNYGIQTVEYEGCICIKNAPRKIFTFLKDDFTTVEISKSLMSLVDKGVLIAVIAPEQIDKSDMWHKLSDELDESI